MKYKVGDKLICKLDDDTKQHLNDAAKNDFIYNKEYEIVQFHGDMYEINGYIFCDNRLRFVDDFFYTKRELREYKLKRILEY